VNMHVCVAKSPFGYDEPEGQCVPTENRLDPVSLFGWACRTDGGGPALSAKADHR